VLSASILSAITLVGTSLITSRLGVKNLDPVELQLWFLVLAAIPFFMLLDLGAYSLLPGKFSYYSQELNKNKLNAYITNYFLTAIAVTIVGVLFVFLIMSFQNGRWFPEEQKGVFEFIFIAAVIARVMQNVLLAFIFAAGYIVYEKTIKTVGSIFSIFLIVYLLKNDFSVLSLPLSWLLSSLITIAMAIVIIEKKITHIFDFSLFSISLSKSVFKTSFKFLFAAVPGMFIYNFMPFRVAQDFSPEYTVQISLMMQISLGIAMLCAIPTSLYVRKIADEYFSGVEQRHGAIAMTKNIRVVSVISSTALVFIYLFQEKIFSIWLGKQVVLNNDFFIIFLLAIWFEVQQTTMTTSLVSTGYVNFLRVNLISALLTLAGYSALINLFGFSGVAIACLGAQLITCHYWNIRKTLVTFRLPLSVYLRQHLYSIVPVAVIITVAQMV
jgi:O-antigen/teichoic acid export membrane protein